MNKILIIIPMLIIVMSNPISADITIEDIIPLDGTEDILPPSVNLTATILNDNGNPMNITFWSNLSGSWDYFYINDLNTTFREVDNDTYSLRVPYLSVYGRTYFWYINATDTITGESFESSIYTFTMIDNPDIFSKFGNRNDAWIIGVVVLFSTFGVIAYIRTIKEKYDDEIYE